MVIGMSEFTKGPWSQKESYDIEIWSDNELVCNIPTWDPDNTGYNVCNEVAANANLIAAAPDMLEALEELTAMVERQPDFNDDGDGLMLSRCHKAIKKAKGESK